MQARSQLIESSGGTKHEIILLLDKITLHAHERCNNIGNHSSGLFLIAQMSSDALDFNTNMNIINNQ